MHSGICPVLLYVAESTRSMMDTLSGGARSNGERKCRGERTQSPVERISHLAKSTGGSMPLAKPSWRGLASFPNDLDRNRSPSVALVEHSLGLAVTISPPISPRRLVEWSDIGSRVPLDDPQVLRKVSLYVSRPLNQPSSTGCSGQGNPDNPLRMPLSAAGCPRFIKHSCIMELSYLQPIPRCVIRPPITEER